MHTAKGQESSIEERKTVAREHSALFPTRLALARWTSSDVPRLHNVDAHYHPQHRAAWFAKAQRDFQAWLDNGGFVQHDPAVDASGRGGAHQSVFWAL